jgi:DNA-binding transcriptional ArsR family regulator
MGYMLWQQSGWIMHIKETAMLFRRGFARDRDGARVSIKATCLSVDIPDEQWDMEVNRKFGLCLIPSLLLRSQQQLGLNPTQLLLLVQLCDLSSDPGQNPAPSKKTLSERLGLSERQIQRHLSKLEKVGMISRIERLGPDCGILANAYDLSGLRMALKKLTS